MQLPYDEAPRVWSLTCSQGFYSNFEHYRKGEISRLGTFLLIFDIGAIELLGADVWLWHSANRSTEFPEVTLQNTDNARFYITSVSWWEPVLLINACCCYAKYVVMHSSYLLKLLCTRQDRGEGSRVKSSVICLIFFCSIVKYCQIINLIDKGNLSICTNSV